MDMKLNKNLKIGYFCKKPFSFTLARYIHKGGSRELPKASIKPSHLIKKIKYKVKISMFFCFF